MRALIGGSLCPKGAKQTFTRTAPDHSRRPSADLTVPVVLVLRAAGIGCRERVADALTFQGRELTCR